MGMGVAVREKPKGSGVWWIFINHNGKRKSKKIGNDLRLAKDVAKKLEAKLVLGDLRINEETPKTFREYAHAWITTTVPATCKPSTLYDYRHFLNKYILPVFGDMPVNDIKRLKIKQFLMDTIESKKSASTVNFMKSAISGVLNLAVDDEIIDVNPAHRLGKTFKVKRANESLDPLTREELATLLNAFKEHYPAHYPQALTLARTGMRLGEVLALRWGDIDFNNRFISVTRSFSRGELGTPKSGKSRRVDMSSQLTETLRDFKHIRKEEAVRKGWGEIPEWVFITGRGTPLDINNWRNKIFNKALEKAKLRQIRIHDLRHTYASLLIQAGESLAYVKDQLGHHSIQITVDIYGHLVPGGNKQAVDGLDDHAPKRTLSAPKSKK